MSDANFSVEMIEYLKGGWLIDYGSFPNHLVDSIRSCDVNYIDDDEKIKKIIRELMVDEIPENNFIHKYGIVKLMCILKYFSIYYNYDIRRFNHILNYNGTYHADTICQLFSTYPKLTFEVLNRIEYYDTSRIYKSDSGIKHMRHLGFTNMQLLKNSIHYTETKLDFSYIINLVDLETLELKNHIIGITHSKYVVDKILYLRNFKQWMESFTTIEYKGEMLKIHNHSLSSLIQIDDIPYKKGNFNLRIHPSTLLKKNYNRYIDLLEQVYGMRVAELKVPEYFDDLPNDIKVLRSGRDLFDEGNTMSHCIGSGGYTMDGIDGKCQYLSVNYNSDISDRFTVAISKNNKSWRVNESYGYKNRKLNSKENEKLGVIISTLNKFESHSKSND